jgi:AcrR family transcriptional regulator
VTRTAEKVPARVSRRQVEKFAERRAQLADAALQTLSELGYARTSLREIAQNSEFSHGVLHYYFTDKVDLITYCVRRYKARCVARYDEIMADATSPEELRRSFAAGLTQTMVADAPMHRLWYDLRAQSLFEPSFRADVAEIDHSLERMIWRIVSRLAELTAVSPTLSPSVSYALFDGLFQQGLLKHLAGDAGAARGLELALQDVLGLVLPINSAPARS